MDRFAALALCIFFSWSALGLIAQAQDPFEDAPAAVDKEEPAADDPFGAPPEQGAKADRANRRVVAAVSVTLTDTSNPDPRSEAKIREALNQLTKMEFTETPLQDAVEFLKDHHGIEIQLDSRALEDAGISSDTPMTRNVNGLSLASGLRLLLADLDATFVIRHGVLLITTEEAAAQMTDLRVYDIDELVGPEADPAEVGKVLESLLPTARLLPPDDARGHADALPTQSPQTITIVPFRNLLVIRAPLEEHDEIVKLLDDFKSKLKSGD